MKTRLFILIFALVASAGTLFAESGTLGDNATVTIGGTVYADGIAESPYTYEPSH